MRGAKLHAAVAGLAVWTLLGGGVHAALGYANDWTDGGITWYFDASPEYEGITDWGDIALSPVPNYVILTCFSYKSADVVSNLTIPPAVLWSLGDGALVHDTQPFLRVIQGGAFTNCAPLRNVTIPELVFKIGVPCFWGCSNLTNITKQSSSSGYQYTSRNGVLYSSTTAGQVLTGLTKYPEGKEGNYFEVPSSVTNLQAGCLANTKLAAVRFTGEKPMCSDSAFTNSQFIGYCPESWGFEWGQTWNGIKMYPIPTGDVTSDGVTYRYEIRDGVAWRYTVTNGGARVTGRGVVPPELRGRVAVPGTLGGYPVTDIEDYAVADCPLVTGATIPASVTNVGGVAFPSNAFDTATVPGVALVDGWVMDGQRAAGHVDLSGMRGFANGVVFSGNTNRFSVVLPNGQRTVGESMFAQCTGLEAVVLPGSVERIEASAFEGCTGMESVDIGSGVARIECGAFDECTGLTAVNIHDLEAWCGIEFDDIEANPLWHAGHLFLNGEEVTEVVVPDGMARVPEYVFAHCEGLKSVVLHDSVESLGEDAFHGCSNLATVVLGAGVSDLVEKGWAFYGCTGLEEFRVAEGNPTYASDGGVLFRKDMETLLWCPCAKRGAYAVPAGTKAVAALAFENCGKLTALELPEGLETIGNSAFLGCAGLTRLEIPDSVRSSGLAAAVNGCVELESIEVGEGNSTYRSVDGVLFGKDGKSLMRYPEGKGGEYAVPAGTTKILSGAFSGCASLRAVTLPTGVVSIASSAFLGCTGLAEISVPKGVTSIGTSAFSGCTGLLRAELPDGLVGVTARAFEGCAGLKSLFLPSSVKTVGADAFAGSGLRWIVVPDVLAAKTESWRLPEGCEVIPWGEWAERRTAEGVPYEWLWENGGREAAAAGDWTAAADVPAANGRTLGECYVAGLDPAEAGNDLQVELSFADGVVKVGPKGEKKEGRKYWVEGKREMMDTEWKDVTGEEDLKTEGWRFFRVGVALEE